jgi:hypothetical protein
MNNHPTNIVTAMLAPLMFFEERCEDKQTLRRLIVLANDKSQRSSARALFEAIRNKTLAAERRKDQLALAQYAFEEICAKTLYNVTYGPAPYDADSPFWVCAVTKAALSSGCKSHPANAPAGSSRSSYGGDEIAEAFGMRVTNR